ncbi:MAG: Mg2+ transporter-C family protein, partial [Candidatus Nomurabacteria bacterium GW2011_GWB1_43_7]
YNLYMQEFFIQNSEIILRLFVAVILGAFIGAERTLVHKEAGIKTHALVSLGAAVFVIVSELVAVKYKGLAGFDPARVASQIIVGIGFLGAGAIMFQNSRLTGLTTAGGLWVTAGIGMAAGFGFFGLSVIAAVFVLAVFVILYFVEKPIQKISDNIDQNGIQ